MRQRYFTTGLLILAGLLAGCRSAGDPPLTGTTCCGSTPADRHHYLTTMKQRIQDNFDHSVNYHGQRCAVSLKYGDNQRYQVLHTAGDEPLCLKAWSVVATTNGLPPPPTELLSGVLIDFSP